MWTTTKQNNLFWIYLSTFLCVLSCQQKDSCNYIYDYHPYIIQAEIAYEEQHYEEAYAFLKQAFDQCTPRNTKTYYEIDKMAKICAKLNFAGESVEMIELQIQNGFTLSKYRDDPVFQNVFESERGAGLVQDYDSLRAQYLQGVNDGFLKKLVQMSFEDQRYRGAGLYKEKQEEQERIDAQNEAQLVHIFESYGYPEEHLIRYSYPDRIDLDAILLHTDDSIRLAYFLPKLKQFVENGDCDPKVYAEVYDQYLLYNGQPQQYGTYKDSDGNLSNSVDLEVVDENRRSIGLPTLPNQAHLHQLKIKNYPDTYGRFFKK